MEQNHLHGQRRKFRIRNNAQKTKKSDVKMTPIRLSFCISTGEREAAREREFSLKKKNQNRSETILQSSK